MSDDSNYFDHDADIGIIGRGDTLPESFVDAARAMFSLMTDLSTIRPKVQMSFIFEEKDNELALVTWLNTLLAKADSHQLIFSQFEIIHNNPIWECKAYGDKWHPDRLRGIEVKGATLTMLSVNKKNNQWEARCVVDV